MKLKIERLEYINIEEDIKKKKDKEIKMNPDDKRKIQDKYKDIEKFEMLPEEFIQDYLDEKTRLGWKLIQVIPIYYPMRTVGIMGLYAIDYYWEQKE